MPFLGRSCEKGTDYSGWGGMDYRPLARALFVIPQMSAAQSLNNSYNPVMDLAIGRQTGSGTDVPAPAQAPTPAPADPQRYPTADRVIAPGEGPLGTSSGVNIAPGSDDDGWVVPPPVPLSDGSVVQLYKDG